MRVTRHLEQAATYVASQQFLMPMALVPRRLRRPSGCWLACCLLELIHSTFSAKQPSQLPVPIAGEIAERGRISQPATQP
jgi:hypothetical protein